MNKNSKKEERAVSSRRDFLKVSSLVGAAIDKTHEYIKYTIPYKESFITFMTIKSSKIIIEPKKTEFVGPGPDELGMPKRHPHEPIVPTISGFKMKIQ